MTIDKAKLKALAEAATQGNWVAEGDDLFFNEDGYTKHLMETSEGSDICHDAEHPANLSFIAAASPDTILALLAEIERLEKFEDWFVRLDQVEQSLAASYKAERDQLKAENEALRNALGDLLALYEDDEGCRSLPEYIAGRAARAKEAPHG